MDLDIVFFFGIGKVYLYQDSLLIGNETLCGDLYRLGLYSLFSFSPNINIVSSTKHLKLNESLLFFGTCIGSYFQIKNIYFEDDINLSQGPGEIVFKEHPVFIPIPIASTSISSLVVDQHPIAITDDEPIKDVDLVALDVDPIALHVAMDIPLRKSKRARSPAISDDYIVYL